MEKDFGVSIFQKIIQVLVMKITVIFLRWENIDWEKEAIVIGA